MARKRSNKPNQLHKRKLRTESLEARRCLAASLGWDGPGQGSTELSYYIGNAPSTIDQASFESAIETALDVWSDVIDVNFTETSRPGQRDSLDFKATNIDGEGGTLAQAYLPDDVNPARVAGDVEFDNSESWEIGNAAGRSAFDLVHVAVHEIGHALGIDHLHESGSVLAPFVSPTQSFSQLSNHDIEAALELYAPAVTDLVNNESTLDQGADTHDEADHSHEDDHEHEDDHDHEADEPLSDNDVEDSVEDETDTVMEEEEMEEDSRETNRHWRPWRRMQRFLGVWRRFGGRMIGSPANHNAMLPSDVNGDGVVSPFDALAGINYLSNPSDGESGAVDTNGDGAITPMDILNVLNDLHKQMLDEPMRPGIIDTFGAQGEGGLTEVGVDDQTEEFVDSDDMMDDDLAEEEPTADTEIDDTETEEELDKDAGDTPEEPVSEVDDETTSEDPPTVEPPSEEETSSETPTEETPSGETSGEESPGEETPTTTVGEETPNETDETDETTGENTGEETSSEESPTAETPADGDVEEPSSDEDNDDEENPTEEEPSDDHDESCPVGWGMSRLFGIVDENDDGEVTEAEAGTGIWMIVSGADSDGNGAVSLEELEAFRPDRATRRFMRLDDNGDGVITEDEVNEKIWERISSADTNEDGVSQEELTAYRESLPPRRFRRLDDNGDGVITEDEVNSRIWNRLSDHDANEDGSITPDEFPELNRGRFRMGRPFRFPRFVGFGFRFR